MKAHSSLRVVLPDRIGRRAVLALAWPLMISRVSDTVMMLVDTLFVSRLGTDALAGIGLAISGTMLVMAAGWGVLMGVRVAVSHRAGADQPEAAARLAWQGLWLAAAISLLTWLCLPLAERGFGLAGAEPEVLPHALAFFHVRTLGAPLFFGYFVLSGYLQGMGDTRTPMIGVLLANALNLALNPLFIFGLGPVPAMGTAGAALATVLANGINLLWLAWRFRRLAPRVSRAPDRALMREITRPGVPMGADRFQEVGAHALFIGFLATSGSEHVAAHVIVMRIVMMSFLPGWAIAEAGGVLVGQALGAGRPQAARESWWSATTLALLFMGAFGLAFVAFPGAFLGIFHPEPEVLALGRRLLWIAAAFQIFDAVAIVGLSALNGAGDNRFSIAVNMVGSWAFKVPLAWLLALPLGLGAPGAWLGLTLEIVALAGATVWRIRGDRWLRAGPEPEPRLVEAVA